MQHIEVDKITLPEFWASALINGDMSGMSESEISQMQNYLASIYAEGWRVVDIARDENDNCEPRFTWHSSMYGGDAQGGNVLDYVMHRTTLKTI